MKDLQDIRNGIDAIDRQIIELLAKRFLYSEEIAEQKRIKKLPIFDQFREENLFEHVREYAKKAGISQSIAESIFREIVHQSRRAQEVKGKRGQ